MLALMPEYPAVPVRMSALVITPRARNEAQQAITRSKELSLMFIGLLLGQQAEFAVGIAIHSPRKSWIGSMAASWN
jgi:hypothetical protein